ncbi:ATP-binding protein [Sphingomonas sp. EC-HK361]|uniref:sensor histidine kinase n=1 Tax=Sphingomonas sp. EC-HK361 TaxID=2038397 RepID=UPI001254304B|nr:HAMP domain-containing sensor histidine kinase [Sphingomonas sp. EC-HK361]VVS99680.1 ATP-binding protein [Sphingomonas sp. EC-HK361]
MGFDRRFTLGLAAWVAALLVVAAGFLLALATPGLAAARLVAGLLVAGVVWGLWRHVARTNQIVARFVEAVRFGDVTARFDRGGGAGFGDLGATLDAAMRHLHAERGQAERDLRYYEALIDDVPVAVLTVDAARGVTLANKVARRLFVRHDGVQPGDFAVYGTSFAHRLAQDGPVRQELLILQFAGGPQHAIVRTAALGRLGLDVRVVTVEPMQGTLDTVEMATQTDLVRVLTHEILNSLTPVTSLAGTAVVLLGEDPPDIADARAAVLTLARRAEGLRHFIESYRAVARAPEVRRRVFGAQPFADELRRLFLVEWPTLPLTVDVPPALNLDADPDLIAQVLINLLRNAAQATYLREGPAWVRLAMTAEGDRVRIAVEDSGPGVPEALRRDIFLPFFTTRAEGTGVGLNLARQIVIAHGGTIEVGQGAQGGALFSLVI